MHYIIDDGENNRTLSNNDKAGANDVQSRSESSVPFCFITNYSVFAMSPYSNSCTLDLNNVDLKNTISVYPNPTTGTFYINNNSSAKIVKQLFMI